jgi:hypothetical protein
VTQLICQPSACSPANKDHGKKKKKKIPPKDFLSLCTAHGLVAAKQKKILLLLLLLLRDYCKTILLGPNSMNQNPTPHSQSFLRNFANQMPTYVTNTRLGN